MRHVQLWTLRLCWKVLGLVILQSWVLVRSAEPSDPLVTLLVTGSECEALTSCRRAATATECNEWAAGVLHRPTTNASRPLRTSVPPGCYLYGPSNTAYFNSQESNSACTPDRRCVCGCLSSPDVINVAVFIGDGTTARARSNPIAVFNRPGTGVRAVNFTSEQVTKDLDPEVYHAVLFPGGGGTTEAEALGSTGMNAVRAFVAGGGGYVGICAGAYLAIQHLHISAFEDMPRPVPNKERGDGNVTLSLTADGADQLGRYNVTQSRLDGLLIFYANGPVMQGGNSSSALFDPIVLATFSSRSVPIEAGYSGPTAGGGAAAVCANRYIPTLDSPGGTVLVSGPHPETDQMDFPDRNGPPAEAGSERAALLVSYVKYVASKRPS